MAKRLTFPSSANYAGTSMRTRPFADARKIGSWVIAVSLLVGAITYVGPFPFYEFVRGIAASTVAVGIGIWLINVLLEVPNRRSEARKLERYVRDLTLNAETVLRILVSSIEGAEASDRLGKVYFFQGTSGGRPTTEEVTDAVQTTANNVIGSLAKTSHSVEYLDALFATRHALGAEGLPSLKATAEALAAVTTTSSAALHSLANDLLHSLQQSDASPVALWTRATEDTMADDATQSTQHNAAVAKHDRALCANTQSLIRALSRTLIGLELWRAAHHNLLVGQAGTRSLQAKLWSRLTSLLRLRP